MRKKLLEIKDLKKSYDNGSTFALNGIDLSVNEGEFIVVIGPSGAGKSTFIRCLNQMVAATSGELFFDGIDISKAKGKKLRLLRSKIGMIFQHYNLIGRTNVFKNVLHGCLGHTSVLKSTFGRYKREEIEEAYDLLVKVGLEKQIYKKAAALSGGQMQRVGICRALMQHPQLLLADEPIASLDPKSAEKVMSYMKEITQERNLTCIVNLHQVDFAKRYATRIVGIHAGEIVFDGKPSQLSAAVIAKIYEGKEEQITLEGENQLMGAVVLNG